MSSLARARELVLAFGWNSTAYQILNPGFRLWFSTSAPGVVGYVSAPGRRVVAGAPVCEVEQLPAVAEEFEREARRQGEGVVYFGAESRLERVYDTSRRHVRIALGAQPVWRPERWTTTVMRHASLRMQFARARNKGVRVAQWPAAVVEQHAGIHQCLREWLDARPLPPLHFLVEPDTLRALDDRLVIVATWEDQPVGFVVASPVPARRGWLIEQFVRGHAAPNGTTESMIDAAVRIMAELGSTYVTLGLAPLSRHAMESSTHGTTIPMASEPRWLRWTLQWVRAHGRRFYHFDGLDAFKAKFNPEQWEPVYAIATETRFSPMSLYAIASAFTNGRPMRTIAGGLGRAVRQEVRWVRERWRRTA